MGKSFFNELYKNADPSRDDGLTAFGALWESLADGPALGAPRKGDESVAEARSQAVDEGIVLLAGGASPKGSEEENPPTEDAAHLLLTSSYPSGERSADAHQRGIERR